MEKVIERLDKVEEYIDDLDDWKDEREEEEMLKWEKQDEYNLYIKDKINRVKETSCETWIRVEQKIDKLNNMMITLLGGLLVGVIALCGTLIAIIL